MKKTQQKARPELADMISWWTKGWRGTFNEELYIKICRIKAKTR